MENNTGYICNKHADLRHRTWQEDNKQTVIKVGDHVKVKFKDNSIKVSEHMWVLITDVEPELVLRGTLDNVPVHLTNVVVDQQVKIKRTDVCEHISN